MLEEWIKKQIKCLRCSHFYRLEFKSKVIQTRRHCTEMNKGDIIELYHCVYCGKSKVEYIKKVKL